MSKQTKDKILRGLEIVVEVCTLILLVLPHINKTKKGK